ncbi:hypothetical protein D3C80_1769310 [compost metagenome]
MPCIFVAVRLLLWCLVNTNQALILRVTPRNRVIFEITESPRKRHVFRAADILIPQKQNTILEHCRADFGEQAIIVNCIH